MWPLDKNVSGEICKFLEDPENFLIFLCVEDPGVFQNVPANLRKRIVDSLNYKIHSCPAILEKFVYCEVDRKTLLLGFRTACTRHLIKVAKSYEKIAHVTKKEALSYGGVSLRKILSNVSCTLQFLDIFRVSEKDIKKLRTHQSFEKEFKKYPTTTKAIRQYFKNCRRV